MAAARTIVFIDLPNITRSLKQYKSAYFDPAELIELAGGVLRVSDVFAYADATTVPEPIRIQLERHSMKLVHVACRKGDTDVDNTLAADWVESVIMRRDINRVVLVAGDGDFRPAFAKAKKFGKRIVIAAAAGSISRHLAVLADEVLFLRGKPMPSASTPESPAADGGDPR